MAKQPVMIYRQRSALFPTVFLETRIVNLDVKYDKKFGYYALYMGKEHKVIPVNDPTKTFRYSIELKRKGV